MFKISVDEINRILDWYDYFTTLENPSIEDLELVNKMKSFIGDKEPKDE